jgi:lysophospholipase L1-like esterase
MKCLRHNLLSTNSEAARLAAAQMSGRAHEQSTELSIPPDKIKKLNALVEKTVKADRQFILCDTWSIFADENGNSKAEEFPDLLHPNAQGYAKWAEALRPILAKLKLEKPQSSAP